MKRIVVIILILIFLLLTFSSCKKKQEDVEQNPTESTAEKENSTIPSGEASQGFDGEVLEETTDECKNNEYNIKSNTEEGSQSEEQNDSITQDVLPETTEQIENDVENWEVPYSSGIGDQLVPPEDNSAGVF